MKTLIPGLVALLALSACAPSPAPQAAKPAPSNTEGFTAILTNIKREPRIFRDCADCPAMVEIPAGTFQMGSPENEAGRAADEGPVHQVTFAKPFALSAFEIRTSEYRRFIESTGRKDINWKMYYTWHTVDVPNTLTNYDDYPVAEVTWQDARDFAAWLSQRTGKHYRLPTEAEWEYAARAGEAGARLERAELREPLPGFRPDSIGYIYPVDAFAANAYGMHEMTSNMGEWIEDCYVANYDHAPSDDSAVEGKCKQRVVRGSWSYAGDDYERIANRDWDYPTSGANGIRLARDLP